MKTKPYVAAKCFSCNYWTLQEVVFMPKGANIICSYCNNSEFMPGNERDIKSFISASKKVFPFLAAREPALQNLKNSGDYISLSKPD